MDEKLRREIFQEYLSARQLNQIPDTLSFDDYISFKVDEAMGLRDEEMRNKGGRIGFEAGTTDTVGNDQKKRENYFDLKRDDFMSMSEYMQSGLAVRDLQNKNMGGPIGYNMGGRMNYQNGGETQMAMMQNPNPQMASRSANTEAGIAAALANERDPNKKMNLAMQIIQSMGEKGVNIVRSSLSSDELQMLSQKIQSASEQGVGSINTPQMAAYGGRMGYQDGMRIASGDPEEDDYKSPPFIDDPGGTFDTDIDEVMKLIETAMPGANPSDVQEAYDRAVLQGFEGSILEFIMIMGGDRRDLGDDMGAKPQGIMSMMRA